MFHWYDAKLTDNTQPPNNAYGAKQLCSSKYVYSAYKTHPYEWSAPIKQNNLSIYDRGSNNCWLKVPNYCDRRQH